MSLPIKYYLTLKYTFRSNFVNIKLIRCKIKVLGPLKKDCGMLIEHAYREVNKGLCVVGRNFFLLLLNCSAWLCLGPA